MIDYTEKSFELGFHIDWKKRYITLYFGGKVKEYKW
jgi:hypothetical protein